MLERIERLTNQKNYLLGLRKYLAANTGGKLEYYAGMAAGPDVMVLRKEYRVLGFYVLSKIGT